MRAGRVAPSFCGCGADGRRAGDVFLFCIGEPFLLFACIILTSDLVFYVRCLIRVI